MDRFRKSSIIHTHNIHSKANPFSFIFLLHSCAAAGTFLHLKAFKHVFMYLSILNGRTVWWLTRFLFIKIAKWKEEEYRKNHSYSFIARMTTIAQYAYHH